MLLFYAVFNENQSSYTKIFDETREKVRKIKKKFPLDKYRRKLDGYEEEITELKSGYHVFAETHNLSIAKRNRKEWRLNKGARLIKECRSYLEFFQNLTLEVWKEPDLTPAPLLTSLTCIILLGLFIITKLNILGQGLLIMFYFLFFSCIEWLVIWFYPILYLIKIVRQKKVEKNLKQERPEARGALRAMRVMVEGDYGSEFVLIKRIFSLVIVFALLCGIIALLALTPCSSKMHLLLVSIPFLLFGGGCFFIGGYNHIRVPYLNYYGQLVVTLGMSFLMGMVTVMGGQQIVPESAYSLEALTKWALGFIFLNGLTFPILFPWLYYHILEVLMEVAIHIKKNRALFYKKRLALNPFEKI